MSTIMAVIKLLTLAIIIILQIQRCVHMWAFTAVAIVQYQGLVKSEMVKIAVPVISYATIGVTVVPMPVQVS